MEKLDYKKSILSELKAKGIMYTSQLMSSLNQYESFESHQLAYNALCLLARQNKIAMVRKDNKDLVYLIDMEWQ
jgi:hypothetical protein